LERNTINKRRTVGRGASGLSATPQRLVMMVARDREKVAVLARRAATAIDAGLKTHRAAIAGQQRVLNSLSYRNVLARGFAVIRDQDNRPVSRAAGLERGGPIEIEFADGRVRAVTGEGATIPEPPPAPKPKKKPKAPAKPPTQGSLF
ncbi:MAG: exodeoxyribonuclease VII large subunit, partial [Martelella sp.]